MKMNLLAAGAFAAVLALPLGAYAQQDQAPPQHASGRATTTPNQQRIQNHWARRFGHLNLSGDQQQRIQSLINQFSQAHPEGSPRDRAASRQLRHQIMGVLSDDQRNQYRQEMQARRAQMRQGQGQMQGQSPDQQGPGGQQYQGQQYQGPQGGPGPQGPGPQDQGPPPDQSGPPPA